MSMTDNEALEWFKGFYNADCEREDFEHTICADCNFPCRHGMPILRAISALEESQQYRAIGTVSEFRELKEKATAKPIKGTPFVEAICPKCEKEICDTYWVSGGIHYCSHCGIAIDWSEGKE